MIPKTVHYCWFGGKEKPEIVKRCIESWHKYLQGYEFIEWNESNFDINLCPYIKDAIVSKKYAFATDIVRLWALYHYGGIYMDCDVEVLKPLDPFLNLDAFTGHETEDLMVTAIMGAIPKHPWIKMLLDYFVKAPLDFRPNTNKISNLSAPYVTRHEGGFRYLSLGVLIYPVETFCPFNHQILQPTPTIKSYTIHHFAGTWLGRTAV